MSNTMRSLQIVLIGVILICGFWTGALLAYQLDVIESKLPNIWTTAQETNLPVGQLEVKDNYGYQTDQYTPIQPATTPIGKEL